MDDKPTLESLLGTISQPPQSSTDIEVIPPSHPHPTTPADRNLPIDSPLSTVGNDVLKLYSMDELDAELTSLSFQYSYPICGNIIVDRKRPSGISICCEPAGQSTSHVGTGRCLRHETQLILAPRSPYTEYLSKFDTLQQIFERFQSRDRAIKDLSEEMNLARTALAFQVTRLQKDKDAKNDAVFDKVILSLEMIRKIAKSMADIQQTEAAGITMESIDAMLWAIQRIMDEEISDVTVRLRIFDRIATEVGFVQVSS